MPKPSLRAEAIARAAQRSAEANGIAPEDQDQSIHSYAAGEEADEQVIGNEPDNDGIDALSDQQVDDTTVEEDSITATANDVEEVDDEQVDEEIVAQDDDDPTDNVEEGADDIDDPVADDRDQRMKQMQEELQILRAQVNQQQQVNSPQAQQQDDDDEVEQVDMAELRRSMAVAAADADEEAFVAAQEEYERELVNQVEQRVSANVQQQTLEQQVHDAATMFGKDFKDVNTDPVLSQVANQQFLEQVKQGVPPMTAATNIGNSLREYRNGLAGQKDDTAKTTADPSDDAKDQLRARRKAKQQSVVEIPSATTRVDNTPAPEKREKTQAEMIELMKQRRGKLRRVAA